MSGKVGLDATMPDRDVLFVTREELHAAIAASEARILAALAEGAATNSQRDIVTPQGDNEEGGPWPPPGYALYSWARHETGHSESNIRKLRDRGIVEEIEKPRRPLAFKLDTVPPKRKYVKR